MSKAVVKVFFIFVHRRHKYGTLEYFWTGSLQLFPICMILSKLRFSKVFEYWCKSTILQM